MKAGLEEMEAAINVFEERLDKWTPWVWRQVQK
jgi:hypothetical protein